MSHVENSASTSRLGLVQDASFAGGLTDSTTSVGTLCISGIHPFVPIRWTYKKQTAVSHSSTEAKTISSDAGLRLEGIPALNMWDMVIDVLVPVAGRNSMHSTKPKTVEISHGGQDVYRQHRLSPSKLTHLQLSERICLFF